MKNQIKNQLVRFRLMLGMIGAILGVSVAALSFGTGGASAAPPTLPADPTAGAMGDLQGSVQTWVMTYGAPTLFALIFLGILIRLGVKWTKRAGKSV